MKAYFIKTISGLIPADADAEKWYNRLKTGQAISIEAHTIRNYQFLKKFYALLRVGFDNWQPQAINSKYGIPEKSFDRFRADVIILAGFYKIVVRLDGSTRIEPKSISFSKMTEEEFAELYSKVIDVMLKHVYDQNLTENELNEIVEKYLSFT